MTQRGSNSNCSHHYHVVSEEKQRGAPSIIRRVRCTICGHQIFDQVDG